MRCDIRDTRTVSSIRSYLAAHYVVITLPLRAVPPQPCEPGVRGKARLGSRHQGPRARLKIAFLERSHPAARVTPEDVLGTAPHSPDEKRLAADGPI